MASTRLLLLYDERSLAAALPSIGKALAAKTIVATPPATIETELLMPANVRVGGRPASSGVLPIGADGPVGGMPMPRTTTGVAEVSTAREDEVVPSHSAGAGVRR